VLHADVELRHPALPTTETDEVCRIKNEADVTIADRIVTLSGPDLLARKPCIKL